MTSRAHGFALAILLVFVAYTPLMKIGNLPTLRADDFVILILFFVSWRWSATRGQGWFFGRGKSLVGGLYLAMAVAWTLAYIIGLEANRYPFLINDAFYTPATVIRLFMVFIIAASARPNRAGWQILIWTLLVAGLAQVVLIGLQQHNVAGIRLFSTRLWLGFEKMMVWAERPGGVLRASGSFGNTNAAGFFMALSAAAAVAIMVFGRLHMFWRVAVGVGTLVAVMWANLFWTASRTCVVAITLASLVTLLLPMLFSARKIQAILILMVVVGLIVVFFMHIDELPLPTRMRSMLGAGGRGSLSFEGLWIRFKMWDYHIRRVGEEANLLTGYGPSHLVYQTVDSDYVAYYLKAGLLGVGIALAMKVAVTVKTLLGVARSRSRAESQVALLIFQLHATLLLVGVTADIFLHARIGHFVAMTAGLACGLVAYQYERDQQGLVDFEPAYLDYEAAYKEPALQ